MEAIRKWIRQELWDQVPVAISVIDRGFHIVEANRTFTQTYGAWRNLPCYQVYKGRKERCRQCGAAETFHDGTVRTREERGKIRNGDEIYYLVHMVPLTREHSEIPYIVEMSTDITATKKLEKEKREAERLAAVGQTVASLAHGIKNVLMGLEGGVYVFESGMKRDDQQRMARGWSMLKENISRISTFVKEFLDFARGSESKVEWCSPNQIAEKVVDLFRDKAAMASIDLRTSLQTDITPAPLDEEGIHTCLVNLVSNALDACESSESEKPHVTLATSENDGVLVFEVHDNGEGMDYEVKKRVFTNFFSTKSPSKGTGLGLLTTKKIVHEHGGQIDFESDLGEGSVFRIRLPRERLPEPDRGSEEDGEERGKEDEADGTT